MKTAVSMLQGINLPLWPESTAGDIISGTAGDFNRTMRLRRTVTWQLPTRYPADTIAVRRQINHPTGWPLNVVQPPRQHRFTHLTADISGLMNRFSSDGIRCSVPCAKFSGQPLTAGDSRKLCQCNSVPSAVMPREISVSRRRCLKERTRRRSRVPAHFCSSTRQIAPYSRLR